MPHVIDGSLWFDPKLGLKTPVAGLTGGSRGTAACYDGYGEALFVNWDGSNINVYRTRDGYETLATWDNSVDLLATVATGAGVGISAGIQRIDGTLYVNVAANWGSRQHRIYRDTSAAQDGSGPWVLHATPSDTGVGHGSMQGGVGEIVVLPSGRWMSSSCFGGSQSFLGSRVGIVTSDDGGLTWATRLNVGWYFGGWYTYGCQRGWAKYGDHWYWGGSGNVDPGKHYKTQFGDDITSIGTLGTGNSAAFYFLASTPDEFFFSATSGFGSAGGGTVHKLADGATPEMLTPTTNQEHVSSTGMPGGSSVSPLVCNIGPDTNPHWVMTNYGQVLGLIVSNGWVVGYTTFN